MTRIYSKSLNRFIDVDRIIGHVKGLRKGPTVIFFGGIHGNESSGVFALDVVLKQLQQNQKKIHGSIYAISGNLNALSLGKRYCTEDLNRIWTDERIGQMNTQLTDQNSEEANEQKDIYEVVQNILNVEDGPFYLIDLHTTSGETIPFVVISDSMINRKFAEQFPIPLILGIEEYLDGALLSYYNSLGYISIGYEAGQHNDLASYENQIAFINLCVTLTGSIHKSAIDYYHYYEQLAKMSVTSKDVYEILYRFKLRENDQFTMQKGFVNFQKVQKGQLLANFNGKEVFASHTGRLFMPLYQNQGKEGFFEIRKIGNLLLRISEILRYVKFDRMLTLLPGIRWHSEKRNTLMVNLNIARFFTKPFLHLLGYRTKRIDKTHLIISSFETNSRAKEYRNSHWKNA